MECWKGEHQYSTTPSLQYSNSIDRDDPKLRDQRILTLRRAGILLACVCYLAVNGWFMLRHMMGDSDSARAAYFFTWDMFPGYETASSRRIIVGVTASGRHLQLLPAPNHRYSAGINENVSRLDWLIREEYVRPVLKRTIRQHNTKRDDRIVLVLEVQQFWPSKFNLPDDLYRAEYDVENPNRRYWRIIGRWDVTGEGELVPERDDVG